MSLHFYTLDVFTDSPFGGNQLAVFPAPSDLPSDRMQRIAREFNLSETVFVQPARSPDALCRLRIYTPGAELPFAGHPTIGTAILLVQLGFAPPASPKSRFTLEEEVGPIPVTVTRQADGTLFGELTAARPPEEGPPPPPAEELAALLGLPTGAILTTGLGPRAYSSGVPFLFIPVRDRATLARAQMDTRAWASGLAGYWAPSVFLFCRDTEFRGADLRARMFAPAMGIVEDPATGSAAAALAGYLVASERPEEGTRRWIVEQGVDMGRPSLLRIEADVQGGKPVAVRVGGSAVRMMEGDLSSY